MPKPQVNEDEHGLHRQPTASPTGTVLRGGSFMISVQEAKRRHQERLRQKHAAAAAAGQAEGDDAATDADGFAVPAPSSRGTSPRHSEDDRDTRPALSRVTSPHEDRKSSKPSKLRASDLSELSREPTMLHSSTQLLPSPQPGKQYTVVLDLDETVVYGREGPLTARAHLKQFLRTLGELAEVVVWTAGERSYAKAIVREINTEGVIRHLVYRDDAWFDEEDYTKDLKKLGRDTDYVLIVENTPDCVRENPTHGIIVSDFEGAVTRRDETLLKLAELVEALVKSGKPVPEFLPTCRTLKRQVVVNEAGTEIPIFYLSGRAKRPNKEAKDGGEDDAEGTEAGAAEGKVVKTNRDKRPRAGNSTEAPTPTRAPRSEADKRQQTPKVATKSDPRATRAAPVASMSPASKAK
uniref:Mitochondrial import inner membrane translocase subunit TIM50 n=2 Tax=Neobodo designis TaxID=312471 RepID=A0A7S1QTH8_NEODS